MCNQPVSADSVAVEFCVCFTTSVFLDSTCRSETGSTASASRRWADRWSLCTGQICCGKGGRYTASGQSGE